MIFPLLYPLAVLIFYFFYPYSFSNFLLRVAFALLFSLFALVLLKGLRFRIKLKGSLIIAMVLLAAVTGSGLLILQGINFAGDEPHYLLITKSIIYDFDLDVKNQYLSKQWQEFYRKEVKILPHANPGRDGGWYPMHLPGISVLLIPFYLISKGLPVEWKNFLLRAGFSLYGLLFMAMFFKILREEFPGREKELFLLGTLTIPIYPYFFHLFPELPAAGILLYLFYRIWYRNPSHGAFLCLGLLGGVLSWFGVKFPVLVFGLLLIIWWRHGFKKAVIFAAGFGAVYSTFLYYLYVHYGALSPAVVYNGMMTPQERLEFLKLVLYKIPLHYRTETFLDYFLGQRDGLLPYAPFYLFGIAGLWIGRRRKVVKAAFLLFMLFYFSYAWLTHRGGYCPPVRPLVPVIWVLLLGLGVFLAELKNENLRVIFKITAFLALITSLLLLFQPLSYYQPTTHDVFERAARFFHNLSNFYFYLPNYLPSYIKAKSPARWLPNYIWSILLLLFLLAIIKFSRTEEKKQKKTLILSLFLVILLPFFLFPNIPLRNGKMVIGDKGRIMVFNARYWRGKCVIAFEENAPVFVLKEKQFLYVKAEDDGELEVTGRKRIYMKKGEIQILRAKENPTLPYKGKKLIQLKVKEKGPFLICFRERHLKGQL